jgi:predicted Zn-dependent protease
MALQAAQAQAIRFIRDAEIERTIRTFATPLFEAAGLDPEAVEIHVVNDSKLNAFVFGGQRLFITTGLLMRTEHAGQVIGVIAHETGHIAGGHLARLEGEQRSAQMQAIISLVLGAVAVAAGQGEVGQAVIAGGTHVAGRQLLTYTRGHEAAADQAAVTYLDRTGQSATGMLEFLAILAHQELLSSGRQDPYARTHPITRDRVSFVRNHVANSKFSSAPIPPEYEVLHARMRGKLVGFLRPPTETLGRYPEKDQSLEARYTRAIAYYRKPDLKHAIPLIDALIAEQPSDPYLHELKGQMLYENGRVNEALAPYQAAVRLLPDSSLLRVGLAQVQIALNDAALNEAALANLHEAVRLDRDYPFTWSQLAVAYGRTGRIDRVALALAEKALLLGDEKETRLQVARAEKLLSPGSAGWTRAQDIKRALDAKR